jgi:hypothetical protein
MPEPARQLLPAAAPAACVALAALAALLLLATFPGDARAAAYACRTADGSIEYKQFPCPEDEEERVVPVYSGPTVTAPEEPEDESEDEDADDAPVITNAQLQGRWTDMPDNRLLASVWHFSAPYLYFDRYNRPEVRLSYTLEDDVIIVHHEDGGEDDGPWDEEMEVVRYTGDTLSWRFGIVIKLSRIP